jgi:hypothetical protein
MAVSDMDKSVQQFTAVKCFMMLAPGTLCMQSTKISPLKGAYESRGN